MSVSSSAASRRRVRPATSRGRTVASSAFACRAREEPGRAAGNELEQQPVQPTHGAGAGAGELVPAVGQQPQRHQLVVDDDLVQPRSADGDHGDGVGVGSVGLAAVSGGEHPRPRRQLRRHVHHLLAVGDQPLGQVPADPVAAFDRPDPIRPPAGRREHLPVAVPVGAEPAAAEDILPKVEDLDRR